jgi:ribonucleoside-diphosphate reductase alpha chain
VHSFGPRHPVSQQIHQEKYRIDGETFDNFSVRIANGVKDSDHHFKDMLDIVRGMRWLPAGRQQLAVGNAHCITAFNCFVSPSIPDDSRGIFGALTDCFQTMRMGGGVGMDFSTLRPNGARIKSLNSQSSGPVSFMKIWDATCSTVQSKGLRRGAMMGVLRIDHPDIQEFIRCKKIRHMVNTEDLLELMKDSPDMTVKEVLEVCSSKNMIQQIGNLTNFNISIGITDEFMRALQSDHHADQMYDLMFEGQPYGRLHAPTVWEEVMRHTWDYAEPGVLFLDRINEMNPLSYCESINATNPCGEQPLPHHGACLLGSMNATAYIVPMGTGLGFNFEQFKADIPNVVRAIDNIIDRTNYPLPEQEKEAKDKRRMGLGITGLSNTIELVWGHRYGSDGYIHCQNTILEILRNRAYKASIQLAEEKGSFPLFDAEKWLSSGFAKTLPPVIRDEILRNGLRNGLLLSIAPTGTISICADNISPGIEPTFATKVKRDVITEDGKITVEFNDWAFDNYGYECTTSGEISAEDHVRVLCAAQKYVDSSISKTCNVGDQVTFEGFKNIYLDAYNGGAKGCTTYRPSGKRAGMMREIKDTDFDSGSACYVDPTTGQKECA